MTIFVLWLVLCSDWFYFYDRTGNILPIYRMSCRRHSRMFNDTVSGVGRPADLVYIWKQGLTQLCLTIFTLPIIDSIGERRRVRWVFTDSVSHLNTVLSNELCDCEWLQWLDSYNSAENAQNTWRTRVGVYACRPTQYAQPCYQTWLTADQ